MLRSAQKPFPVAKVIYFREDSLTAEVTALRRGARSSTAVPAGLFSALRNSQWVRDRRGAQVKKLYIGNLPFSATEEQLNEWFAQVGVSLQA